jgi:hypothetical protein
MRTKKRGQSREFLKKLRKKHNLGEFQKPAKSKKSSPRRKRKDAQAPKRSDEVFDGFTVW